MIGSLNYEAVTPEFDPEVVAGLDALPCVAQAPCGVGHATLTCPVTGAWQVECRSFEPQRHLYVLRKLPRRPARAEFMLLDSLTGECRRPAPPPAEVLAAYTHMPSATDYTTPLHDCRGLDFNGALFTGKLFVDFSQCDLSNTVWDNVNLTHCLFGGALTDSTFAVGSVLDVDTGSGSVVATVLAPPVLALSLDEVEVWLTDIGLVFRWRAPSTNFFTVGTLDVFCYDLARMAQRRRETLASVAFSAGLFIQE